MIKQEIQNKINQISNDLDKVAHIPKSEGKKLMKQRDILYYIPEWQKLKTNKQTDFLKQYGKRRKKHKRRRKHKKE